MAADGQIPISPAEDEPLTQTPPAPKQCRVITVGNEKGGAGKSTVSVHLAVALMRMGKSVGIIDLDVRQRTLTRYLENRHRWLNSSGAKVPMPESIRVDASTERDLAAAGRQLDRGFHCGIRDQKPHPGHFRIQRGRLRSGSLNWATCSG